MSTLAITVWILALPLAAAGLVLTFRARRPRAPVLLLLAAVLAYLVGWGIYGGEPVLRGDPVGAWLALGARFAAILSGALLLAHLVTAARRGRQPRSQQ